jgi:hypothetical protein
MNPKIVAMFGRNAAITAASVLTWILIGWITGAIAGGMREPEAVKFFSEQSGFRSIETRKLDRYYETRDNVIGFCAWVGLLSAQVVFVLGEVAQRRAEEIAGTTE